MDMIKAKVTKVFNHTLQKQLFTNEKKILKKAAKDIVDVEKKVIKAKTSRKKKKVPLDKPIEETYV